MTTRAEAPLCAGVVPAKVKVLGWVSGTVGLGPTAARSTTRAECPPA
jgi:hypothetical protein